MGGQLTCEVDVPKVNKSWAPGITLLYRLSRLKCCRCELIYKLVLWRVIKGKLLKVGSNWTGHWDDKKCIYCISYNPIELERNLNYD